MASAATKKWSPRDEIIEAVVGSYTRAIGVPNLTVLAPGDWNDGPACQLPYEQANMVDKRQLIDSYTKTVI